MSFTSQEEIKSGIEKNLCTLKEKEPNEMTVNIVTGTPMAFFGRSTLNPGDKIQQNFSFGSCLI